MKHNEHLEVGLNSLKKNTELQKVLNDFKCECSDFGNSNSKPNKISKKPLMYTNSNSKNDKYGGIIYKNHSGCMKCFTPTFI